MENVDPCGLQRLALSRVLVVDRGFDCPLQHSDRANDAGGRRARVILME